MSVYYNTVTQEYPRYEGDIKLLDPAWEPGKSLPENWVAIDEEMSITCDVGYVIEEKLPVLEGGIWKRTFVTREETQEEIDTTNKLIQLALQNKL